MDSKEKNVERLRTGAWCYVCALWSHIDRSAEGVDVDALNYIAQQAHFVRCFAEECVEFLEARGVCEVGVDHLQYFFSMEPPVYRPYSDLWVYVYCRMSQENMLPRNAEKTAARLLAGKRRHKTFLNRKA